MHFEPVRVKPNQASIQPKWAGWLAPLTASASAFNRLGQCANSPDNIAYCYAELAVSSLAVAITIASTHYVDLWGMATLSVALLDTKTVSPRTVSHLSTNLAQRRVTSLMCQ